MIKYIQLLKSKKEDKRYDAKFYNIDRKKIKVYHLVSKEEIHL